MRPGFPEHKGISSRNLEKTMVNYPITVHEENGHFWSSCKDLPEAHSAGDTLDELLANAVEGIQLALSIYVDQGRSIPEASAPEPGQYVVHQPVQVIAKAGLWNAMRDANLRVADLARLLGLSHPTASRLVDFQHNSKIEQLETALLALNSGIRVTPKDPNWIDLPYGGAQAGFYVGRLSLAFRLAKVTEMPIGAVKADWEQVKDYSLDYLLRTRYARNPNTMQAVTSVIDDLVRTGIFERGTMEDPKTGRTVDCLRLLNPNA